MKRKLNFFAVAAVALLMPFMFFACEQSDDQVDYSEARKQLLKDYEGSSVTNMVWKTVRGYQVVEFQLVATKAVAQATAWYSVSGNTAKREKSSESIGVAIPEVIEAAFNATKYKDATVWRIQEVELEVNYNGNAVESVYEVELELIADVKVEAEMYFNSTTGELLYAKESVDNDDDTDEDIFVVNEQLANAVRAIYPDAVIIDAELDDDMIEVEVSIVENGLTKEVEMIFSLDYVYQESEIEYTILYSELPAEFVAIPNWFSDVDNNTAAPAANAEVEVEEGSFSTDSKKPYKYSIEIESVALEISFSLDSEYKIVEVEKD